VIPSFVCRVISCLVYKRDIDDPPKGQKGSAISDFVIDLYQGGKTANLRKGAVCPKSLPFVASNFNICSEARYA